MAVASFTLSIKQGDELEAYRRVTTKPVLSIDRIFAPTEGYDGVGVYLSNVGNGVGVVVSGEVTYGGASLENASGQFAGMADVIMSQHPEFPTLHYSGPRFGAVQVGTQRLLLGISVAQYTPEYGEVLERFIRGMGIRFEYRSLYEDDETTTVVLYPDTT